MYTVHFTKADLFISNDTLGYVIQMDWQLVYINVQSTST